MLSRRFHISLFIALVFGIFLLSHLAFSRGCSRANHLHQPDYGHISNVLMKIFQITLTYQPDVQDSAGTINQASLVLTFNPDGTSENHSVSINKQGNVYVASWREDTSHGHFIPPGVQVTYNWKFT